MSWEVLRTLILITGWPILVIGSVFVLRESLNFYKNVKMSVFGKLVLGMAAGWLASMYSLGIVATGYMLDEAARGTKLVLPIFLVWFITMVALSVAVRHWNKEAVILDNLYLNLERLVKERTGELEKQKSELEEVKGQLEQRKISLEDLVEARTKELEKAKGSLEAEVAKRTSQLQEKLEELERMSKAMVGRELKMVELKEALQKAQGEIETQKKKTS